MKLRVGIVNVGPAWETRHLPALRALTDRIEVRTVCDPVQHRAQIVAGQLGAAVSDSYQLVARRSDIDALLLLSGRWYGALPIFAACDAGKAVYSAAVFNIEDTEAAQLRTRVAQAGIAFMAEFPCRMSAATLRLKELIATRLGQPRLLFCNNHRTENLQEDQSRDPSQRRAYDLVQCIDWCRYVMDSEPTSLVSVRHKMPTHWITEHETTGHEASDYSTLFLDFSPENETGVGPLAQIGSADYIRSAWRDAASYRRPAELEVVCDRGVAFVDLPSSITWFDEAGQHSETLDHERPVGEQMLIHFHRAVESLVLKTSSLADAHRALSIASKSRQSYQTGRRVNC
jgi:predicted dehydrogenase